MALKVNATRQELSRLRARIKMATRGHKLLKDKRDQLMKEFLSIVHENQRLREELDSRLAQAYRSFAQARAWLSPRILEEALMVSGGPEEVSIRHRNILNVVVPEMELKQPVEEQTSDIMPYGLATTSADLDDALREFRGILSILVKLSEVDRKTQLLADEIEKTRRRVNALEYILIPELLAAAKDVEMKLEEVERSTASRLMKVKDIVRAR